MPSSLPDFRLQDPNATGPYRALLIDGTYKFVDLTDEEDAEYESAYQKFRDTGRWRYINRVDKRIRKKVAEGRPTRSAYQVFRSHIPC